MAKKDLYGNKKVAASRGEKWKKKLSTGRMDAENNPSYIRIMRRKKLLKQEQVAKQVGIKESSFGAIERGFRPVKKEAALKIAKVLEMPMNRIFKPDPHHKNKFVAVIRREVI